MKIKRLRFVDCLGIEELAINPTKVTKISGGNEKGKTSILEAIEKVLSNTNRRERFVRVGADKAVIELETDTGLTITRTIKEDKDGTESGSIKVLVDGKPIATPQSYLNALFGASGRGRSDVFAFNPVDFLAKKDKDQTDILLGMLPISVTDEELAAWFSDETPKITTDRHGLQVIKAAEKYFYDARWAANQRVKAVGDEVEAIRKRLPDNYDAAKWENESLATLYDQLRDAENRNRNRQDSQAFIDGYADAVKAINNRYLLEEKEATDFAQFRLQKVRKEIDEQKTVIRESIADIDRKIAELQQQKAVLGERLESMDRMGLTDKEDAIERELAAKIQGIGGNRDRDLQNLHAQLNSYQEFLVAYPEIDTDPLLHICKHTEEMKQFLSLAKELGALEGRLARESETAALYDRYVQFCREKPVEMLSKVELPVEGLGIDDNGNVTIKGLPIKNLSTARQVKVCLDIARAYAKNTPLKLICVDKMEHLDEDARDEFFNQITQDDGYQYFTTTVTNGDLLIEGE